MEKRLLLAFLLGILFLQSCNEEPIPVFNLGETVINTDEYTGEPVTLLYSLDNGLTFSPDLPSDITEGKVLLVKVNDGSEDLTKENYLFDWSESTPKPVSSTSDLATFNVVETISITLKLKDILVLVTNNSIDGKFYSVNTTSGARIEIFTPTFNDAPLTGVRAFLHHPEENLYYASASESGKIYSIDPFTKKATVLNENNGAGGHAIWTEVSNWLLAPDDSLLSVGDFGADGVGIVKFGTTGMRGGLTNSVNACCGLGLTWGINQTQVIITNDSETGPGEIQLDFYSLDGNIRTRQIIQNLENFPEDISNDDLVVTSLAKDKDNKIFAILVDETSGKTYFVRIFTLTGRVNYLATFGEDATTRFTTLAYIPKHLL
jgi:hypothetical protein